MTRRFDGPIEHRQGGRRDASRLLASVSLMVQQISGVVADVMLVPSGDEGVIAASENNGLLIAGLSDEWSRDGLGAVRLALAQKAQPALLLVRGGLRPGGLAPQQSLTRFTWTLAGASR